MATPAVSASAPAARRRSVRRGLLVLLLAVAWGLWGPVPAGWSMVTAMRHALLHAVRSNGVGTPHWVTVSEPVQVTNLAGQTGLVEFAVTFTVRRQALAAAAPASAPVPWQALTVHAGTGSLPLDAQIQSVCGNVARRLPRRELASGRGAAVLAAQLQDAWDGVFGPGTVSAVYLPTLVVQ